MNTVFKFQASELKETPWRLTSQLSKSQGTVLVVSVNRTIITEPNSVAVEVKKPAVL